MITSRQILFITTLFLANSVLAQQASVKATVNKQRILIGEPIDLTVQAFIPTGQAVAYPLIDSIEHFELLEKPVEDTIDREGGIDVKRVYKITSFDSGHWVIPSFVILKDIGSDTIPVDVIFSDFDPNQDYHDIKDILDVKIAKKPFPWWWFAGGAIVLALIIFYLAKKKKKPVTTVPAITINPYDEAMEQLDQLKRNPPAAKEYYSRLSDIFRLYVFRRKGILSLQKTTDDLVVQLKSLELSKEQFDSLSQSLRLGDFVKFARFIPSQEDNSRSFDEIKKAVVAIERMQLPSTPGQTGVKPK